MSEKVYDCPDCCDTGYITVAGYDDKYHQAICEECGDPALDMAMLASECRTRAEKAEALVADLENQIAEGLAGMDQAKGRIAELEEALGLLIDEIGLSVPDQPQEFDANNFWRAFAKANQALSSDGSAYADVVRAAREFKPGDTLSELALMRAVDKMDGEETQDG